MAKIITDNPESVNEQESVTYVEDKLKEAENPGLERQWYLNIAYLTGKQWLSWDSTRKQLYEPPKEWWEERVVSNQILPIVRTELAKMTKTKPAYETRPATNEEEDIQVAKICTKFIDFSWDSLDMDDKRFESGLWKLVTGTVFLKPYWDPTKGDFLEIDEESSNEIFLGDIATDVVSPFDMKFDPSAQSWEQVRWCCEDKLRTVDYIEEKYGVKVSPEDNLVSTNIFEGMLATLNGFNNDTGSKSVKDGVRVKEYWEIPSKKHPKGRHITIANGKLLQYEDNPYGKLPYICFIHIRVPGRVHGRSIIEDLIPLQREYNKIRSKRVERRNRAATPRILAPKNCLLDEPTNAYGEIVEYDPSRGKPEWEQLPPEPGHIEAELERLLRDMEQVSGIHDVSQGSTPPGVKSGVAIAYLQEQDDTKMGPTIHAMENGYRKWAADILALAKKYYVEPRLIKVLGKNNEIEVFEFKGSDIPDNTDVRVVSGSMMPQNKAAKQEFVMNLVDRKIITDQQLILKLLEFGSIEEVFEEITIDINQAKTEQKKWLEGDVTPIVRDFFNHATHIHEHNKFRKSDKYEQLDPMAQQAIDLHVQQHQAFLMPPPMPIQPGMPPMGVPPNGPPPEGGMPLEEPMG